MAAGQASARGLKVLVLEKKHLPARKLGITGKGRCNLTNTATHKSFLNAFANGASFMRFALGRFDSEHLVAFFKNLNVNMVEERGGRVFPASQQASEIVRSLIKWARDMGVTIMTDSRAGRLVIEDNSVKGLSIHGPDDTQFIEVQQIIIATGGCSYPATGSTGDGYRLAREAGHNIITPCPALVPLETQDNKVHQMQGLSLRNVQADLLIDDKKKTGLFGEMLFTHFGVSGPIILTMSRTAVQALMNKHKVTLRVDLKPAVDHAQFKQRIARVMHQQGKKKISNILKEFLPLKMIPVFLEQSCIDPDKPGNAVNNKEQKMLRLWCKELLIKITGYRSFNEAIVTSGGVDLKEVNPKTMESRKVKGLYFAGEVLDVDADTGGFNLQAAFSTGWVAGNSVGH